MDLDHLVDGLREGDRNAQREFWERCLPPLEAFIQSEFESLPQGEREDVCSVALAKAVTRIGTESPRVLRRLRYLSPATMA